LGYILGDFFFANSSGHPGQMERAFTTVIVNPLRCRSLDKAQTFNNNETPWQGDRTALKPERPD
jgi:hypothetical protein